MGRLNTINGGFIGLNSMVNAGAEPEYIGSTMIFAQATTPIGWTKLTNYDGYALRVVSGTGNIATANQPFTTVFNTDKTMFSPESGTWPVTVNSVTITTAQMENHQHPVQSQQGFSSWNTTGPGSSSSVTGPSPVNTFPGSTGGSAGSGGGHTHPTASITAISYNSPFNFDVKYMDVIAARYY